MPDLRFIGTGLLLKKREIRFRDIYDNIPPDVIRKALKITYPRIKKLEEDPTQWSIVELEALAELFQMETTELAKILDEDIRR